MIVNQQSAISNQQFRASHSVSVAGFFGRVLFRLENQLQVHVHLVLIASRLDGVLGFHVRRLALLTHGLASFVFVGSRCVQNERAITLVLGDGPLGIG